MSHSHVSGDETLTPGSTERIELASSADDLLAPSGSAVHDRIRFTLQRQYQKVLDDVNPYFTSRWCFTAALAVIYALRIYFIGGFHIVTYALGIYMLNLFIGFLTPLVDPAKEKKVVVDEEEAAGKEEEPEKPAEPDDFKPFIRRIPEFKWWLNVTRALLLSLFATLFPFLDIPVFWPILLIYFIALTALTLKQQIKHMWKHKYIPLVNVGKPRFA